ncbi:MAG: hypothetical protein WAO14_13305, partial [Pseudolabrys sp.]
SVQRGCGTVPSKKQPTRITQALPDARVIPRVRLLSESESKEGIAASGMVVTTEVSNSIRQSQKKANDLLRRQG